MKYLILDTSTNYLYVSFVDDNKQNKEIFKEILECKNNHSENLMTIIQKGLKETSLNVKDFDRIIVGIGPGSYTGLRVSLTVAKMFSWSLNIPLYTISSLDIVGSGYFSKDGSYAITTIAKRDYLYTKIINVKNSEIEIIDNDRFIQKEDFFNQIKDKNYQLITNDNLSFDCFKIIKMATDRVVNLHDLVPNYLRKAI